MKNPRKAHLPWQTELLYGTIVKSMALEAKGQKGWKTMEENRAQTDIQKMGKGRAAFIIVGFLLILDTLMVRRVSGWNMGVILPAILGIPLAAYGVWYEKIHPWFQSRWGKIVKYVFVCGYILFFLIVGVCSGIMIHAAQNQPAKGADAVIVLGGGVSQGHISQSLKGRLDTALEYWEENPETLVVVSGGQGADEPTTEAQAMAEYLTSEGMDSSKIIEEDQATSTYENFLYSKALLEPVFGEDGQYVYITSDFHVYRAGLAAQEAGVAADGLAAPSPLWLAPNSYMRETLALMRYWVFGVR